MHQGPWSRMPGRVSCHHPASTAFPAATGRTGAAPIIRPTRNRTGEILVVMCAALQPKVSQGGKRRRDRAEVSAIATGRVLICISEDLPEPTDAGDGDLGSDIGPELHPHQPAQFWGGRIDADALGGRGPEVAGPSWQGRRCRWPPIWRHTCKVARVGTGWILRMRPRQRAATFYCAAMAGRFGAAANCLLVSQESTLSAISSQPASANRKCDRSGKVAKSAGAPAL